MATSDRVRSNTFKKFRGIDINKSFCNAAADTVNVAAAATATAAVLDVTCCNAAIYTVNVAAVATATAAVLDVRLDGV